MLKDKVQAKKSSLMPSLPRPAKIGVAIVVGLIIIIVSFSLLGGRKSGGIQPFITALARANETLRVTSLVQQQLQLQDLQTQALAATVSSTLTSDKQQFTSYLTKNKAKITPAQLALDIDKTSDTSLQAASQNNNLDEAYVRYLKDALAKYQQDLQVAYKSAGPNGKKLLQESFESTVALLSSPPLKS